MMHYGPTLPGERPHRYQRPDGPVGLRGPSCCSHGYSHPIHEPTWAQPKAPPECGRRSWDQAR